MLWLCISLPKLPVEALLLTERTPLAVTRLIGRRRHVIACNDAAERLGIAAGADHAVARAIHPQLRDIERNPRAERSALERLAQWAIQWSNTLTLHMPDPDDPCDHAALWLEIGASLKLFGGCRALLARIEAEAEPLGYTIRLGVAPTLAGAALLARLDRHRLAGSIRALRARADKASISFLALAPDITHALWMAGIRSIGELLAVPRAAVARRFGPDIGLYLDRLLDLAPDPRPAYQLPLRYDNRCELGAEIDDAEALLFPLRRMLFELQGYLQGVDAAMHHCLVRLEHRGQSTTQVEIGVSTPSRDANVLFALVRERFHRLDLPAAVLSIHLQVEQLSTPTVLQNDLFSDRAHSSEQLRQVLDKLRARLGIEAVQGIRPVADHRPEAAWKAVSPGTPVPKIAALSARPIWLLPSPQPIEVPETLLSGPERLESGWWTPPHVRRDYYISRTADGARWWVFQDHTDRSWYLHGIWA